MIATETAAEVLALPDAGRVFQSRYSSNPHNPEFCCAAVYTGSFHRSQCSKQPSVWRDVMHGGKQQHLGYCGTHDPVKVAIRHAAKRAKSTAVYNGKMAQWAREDNARKLREAALEAVRKIAAGHNDPRGLAQDILAEFGRGSDAL